MPNPRPGLMDQVAHHALVRGSLRISFVRNLPIGTPELFGPLVVRLAAPHQPHISTLRILEQHADAGTRPAATPTYSQPMELSPG
jgi:hypothetical protein